MRSPSGSMPGQRARARAGREDDVRRAQLAIRPPPRARPRRGRARRGARVPSNTAIPFFFIRCFTPVESRLATARERATTFAEVEAHVARLEAEVVEMAQQVLDLGGAQQRLRRNAAPVEADAAEVLALDERGRKPSWRGADRRDVAAGTAADHDHVEVGVRHRSYL